MSNKLGDEKGNPYILFVDNYAFTKRKNIGLYQQHTVPNKGTKYMKRIISTTN